MLHCPAHRCEGSIANRSAGPGPRLSLLDLCSGESVMEFSGYRGIRLSLMFSTLSRCFFTISS